MNTSAVRVASFSRRAPAASGAPPCIPSPTQSGRRLMSLRVNTMNAPSAIPRSAFFTLVAFILAALALTGCGGTHKPLSQQLEQHGDTLYLPDGSTVKVSVSGADFTICDPTLSLGECILPDGCKYVRLVVDDAYGGGLGTLNARDPSAVGWDLSVTVDGC